VTQVQVRLDELELHEDGAVVQAAHKVHTGVEQRLLDGGEDRFGGGLLVRSGVSGRDDALVLGLTRKSPERGPADCVAVAAPRKNIDSSPCVSMAGR
jgi:hypothetical protein